MELVDRLLAILAGPNPPDASKQLMTAGHTRGPTDLSGVLAVSTPSGKLDGVARR